MSKKSPFVQALSEVLTSVGLGSDAGTTAKPEVAAQASDVPARKPISEPAEASGLAAKKTQERSSQPEPKRAAGNMIQVGSGNKLTLVASGTTIVGNLMVQGSAQIAGCLRGNIECSDCLTVSGEIVGASKTSEIEVAGARIEGDIESRGNIKISDGAVVIGNVTGQAMQISGALKGNIILSQHLKIGSTAVIVGDIEAGSINIENGAVVNGRVIIRTDGTAGDVFGHSQKDE